MQTSDYVTILAGHFLQPLTTVVAKLLEREREGIPGVQANNIEVDWSVSAILLAATMFESWLGRVRLDQGRTVAAPTIGSQYYAELRRAHATLPDLDELFVLRNAIAHNHIWNVEFEWGAAAVGALPVLRHLDGGNGGFRNVVDFDAGLTLTHSFHVVPNLIDRTDLSKVLTQIVAALQQLVALRLLQPNVLNHVAIFGADGARMNLVQLADHVRRVVGVP